jgi:hypothetical protein
MYLSVTSSTPNDSDAFIPIIAPILVVVVVWVIISFLHTHSHHGSRIKVSLEKAF